MQLNVYFDIVYVMNLFDGFVVVETEKSAELLFWLSGVAQKIIAMYRCTVICKKIETHLF